MKTIREWMDENNVTKAYKANKCIVAIGVKQNEEFDTAVRTPEGHAIFLRQIEDLEQPLNEHDKIFAVDKKQWSAMTETNMFIARDNPAIQYMPNSNLKRVRSDYDNIETFGQ